MPDPDQPQECPDTEAPQGSPDRPEDTEKEEGFTPTQEWVESVNNEIGRLEAKLAEAKKQVAERDKADQHHQDVAKEEELRGQLTQEIQDREDELLTNSENKRQLHDELEDLKKTRDEGHKPILCLNFDGVCHRYDRPWMGPTVIPDPPVPGLFTALQDYSRFFQIHIFSTRSNQPGGIAAMKKWLGVWAHETDELGVGADLAFLNEIQWPIRKPPAMIGLDDRVLTFTGDFPTSTKLRAFTPWNRRSTL